MFVDVVQERAWVLAPSGWNLVYGQQYGMPAVRDAGGTGCWHRATPVPCAWYSPVCIHI